MAFPDGGEITTKTRPGDVLQVGRCSEAAAASRQVATSYFASEGSENLASAVTTIKAHALNALAPSIIRVGPIRGRVAEPKPALITSKVVSMSSPQILRPYNPEQVMTSQEVSRAAHVHEKTARDWARRYNLGRMISGKMAFDRIAVHLHLEGESELLSMYLSGERSLPAIRAVYRRLRLPLPGVNAASE